MKPRRVRPTLTTLGTRARVLVQPRGRCLVIGRPVNSGSRQWPQVGPSPSRACGTRFMPWQCGQAMTSGELMRWPPAGARGR